MANSNRLELDIVANDQTSGATSKAKANFESIETQAVKAASGASKAFDQQAVELVRSVERSVAGASRALQTLEQRAALAGKTGVEKLLTQRSISIDRAGGDEAQIQRIVGAYDKLITNQQRLDSAQARSRTQQAGQSAGAAVLPGAAGFESALSQIQKKDRAIADLERQSRFSGTDAVGRLAIEEADSISQLGRTPADIERITAAYAKLKQDATPAARSLAEGLDDIGNRATRVGGTLAILSIPLALGAKHAIDLASQLESARVGFETLGGSAAGANKHIADLQVFAAESPFDFTAVLKESKYLQASGFKVDEVIPTLRAFGNAVAAGGGNTDEFERVLLQVGQIRGTGRATLQDLKPIAQAGVPVFDILAEAVRKPKQTQQQALEEVRKGLENGRFGAIPTIQFLTKAFSSGKYANAAEKQNQTIGGQIEQLRDKTDIAFTAIGEGAAPSVSKFVAGAQLIIAQVQSMATAFQGLPQPVKDVSVALAGITIAAPSALFALGGLAQASSFAFQGISKFNALIGLGASLGPVVGSLVTLATAVGLVGAAFAGWKLGEWVKTNLDGFATGLGQAIQQVTGLRVGALLAPGSKNDAFDSQVDADVAREAEKLKKYGIVVPRGNLTTSQYSAALHSAIETAGKAGADKKTAGNLFGGEGDEGLAKEIRTKQSELRNSADELFQKVALRPQEGERAFDNLTRKRETLYDANGKETGFRYVGPYLASVRDKEGNLKTFRVEDETIRLLFAARAAYAQSLNLKVSEAQIKSEEETFERRRRYEDAIFEKRQAYDRATLELETANAEKVYAHENDLAGYGRDERLNALNGTRPQTVAGKLGLEQRKLGIEQDYLLTSSVNDADKVIRERDRQLTDVAADRFAGKITDQEYFDRVKAVQESAAIQGTGISDKYTHDVITAQQNAANASTQIVRDAQLKQFDSLKSSVEGVLQATETRGVGVFQAIGNAAKSALLGAFNQIVSSQIAASLFRILNPGQTVEFDANGQGKGKFGGLLGTQPVFGGNVPGITPLKNSTDTNTGATDRNTDAVRELTSALQQKQLEAPAGKRGGGFGLPGFGLAGGLGLSAILATGLAFGGSLIDRTGGGATGVTGADEGIRFDESSPFSPLGGSLTAGSGGGSFISGGESAGIPSGYSIHSPVFQGDGIGFFGSGPLGGILGGKGGGLGGILGKGGGLKGAAGSLNQLFNGAFHSGNTVGLSGNLSQLGHSQAALLGGGLLVADGLRRGGTLGTIEDTAGGALIGFKFGGPIGAAVGAAVGLGTGLIRQFFFKGARQEVKDEVKRVYGIEISNGISDQILQIAKQSYGGDWHVAIRSQQVRDLIKLYAQTLGNSAQQQFVNDTIHSSSLVESGGRLQQGAIYDNGQAYTYSSSLPTLNGINSSILATTAKGAGQTPNVIHLDKSATVDLIRTGSTEAISQNPGLVSTTANRGYSQSAGRANATKLTLLPSAKLQ